MAAVPEVAVPEAAVHEAAVPGVAVPAAAAPETADHFLQPNTSVITIILLSTQFLYPNLVIKSTSLINNAVDSFTTTVLSSMYNVLH